MRVTKNTLDRLGVHNKTFTSFRWLRCGGHGKVDWCFCAVCVFPFFIHTLHFVPFIMRSNSNTFARTASVPLEALGRKRQLTIPSAHTNREFPPAGRGHDEYPAAPFRETTQRRREFITTKLCSTAAQPYGRAEANKLSLMTYSI